MSILEQLFDKKKIFLNSLTVSSFMEGRIRCYSKLLKNNPQNEKLLTQYFKDFEDIGTYQINSITGSILIEYNPDLLHKNKELTELEKELYRIYKTNKAK